MQYLLVNRIHVSSLYVFPEGIPVGIVENSVLKEGDSYHTIRVRLHTNFKRLRYIEVVQNADIEELEELQNGLD